MINLPDTVFLERSRSLEDGRDARRERAKILCAVCLTWSILLDALNNPRAYFYIVEIIQVISAMLV